MNIELKVITSTAMTTAMGIGAAVLNAVEGNHALMGGLGATYQALILAIAPGLLTFYAGWKTKHTPRPDLPVTTPAPPA